jgi:hypothetical protein
MVVNGISYISGFSQNWFTFLQSLGIIGGLLFTRFSLRTDARVRRIGNLITITDATGNFGATFTASRRSCAS